MNIKRMVDEILQSVRILAHDHCKCHVIQHVPESGKVPYEKGPSIFPDPWMCWKKGMNEIK